MKTNKLESDESIFAGKYILPGGIDMNVHLQRPAYGTQTIDDFYQVGNTRIICSLLRLA
jgi:dihydroorotase-like cyclic amidohydrolase